MVIHQHSLLAYNQLRPSLNRKQEEIFNCIKQYGWITRQTIAKKLNLEINCVTGRVTELLKKEVIKEDGEHIVAGKPRALLTVVDTERGSLI